MGALKRKTAKLFFKDALKLRKKHKLNAFYGTASCDLRDQKSNPTQINKTIVNVMQVENS